MVLSDYLWWAALLAAPILGVAAAAGIYNAVCASRRKELLDERDRRHERDYLLWWETVKGGRGLVETFTSIRIEPGETCYLSTCQADLYFPDHPCGESRAPDGPVFDIDCGVSVGRNWSVMDFFSPLTFAGHGQLSVTDRHFYFRNANMDLRIPLENVHTVAASCSCILVGTENSDRPLLVNAVNGQRIRDTLHILIDGLDAAGRESAAEA